MPIASLVVRIAADIADFEKNISAVERALQKTGNNLEQIGTQLTKGLTLPILAIAGVSAKAAIDFESSFAGVRKTVDATEDQFKELEGAFRDLAKTMPLTVNEINKVAESAGQLGVKRESIVAFTESMIKLGTATNLTADEAATGMAQFANALGQPRIDMEKLGSALVALGNDGASTEKEILALSGRMAGAGAQINLTAGEIFGMANALASVRVDAEKGGTAISRLFNDLNKAATQGGESLKNFAEVAFGNLEGASEKFATLFRKDAAAAITAFVEGLHDIKAAGGNLLPVLDQLGITELRYRDTVLLAANAGKEFAASVKLGNQAFNEGKALNEEYQERLKTTASQLIILKNNLMDVAVTFGQAMLPAINRVVSASKPLVEEVLGGLADGFKALPGPIRDVSLAFLAVLAAAGPVVFIVSQVVKAWASLLLIVKFVPLAITGIANAFIFMAGTMGATTTGLTGVTGAMVLLRSAAAALLAPLVAIPLALLGIVAALPNAVQGLKNLNAAVQERRFWEFITTKDAPGIWEPEFWGISRSAKAAAISVADLGKATTSFNIASEIAARKSLKDTLTGENVASQVRALANAFAELSPAAQRSADTMKRTGAEALRLRDAGGHLTPELEKLANSTMRSLASETKKAATEFGTLTDALSGANLQNDLKQLDAAFKQLDSQGKLTSVAFVNIANAARELKEKGVVLPPQLLEIAEASAFARREVEALSNRFENLGNAFEANDMSFVREEIDGIANAVRELGDEFKQLEMEGPDALRFVGDAVQGVADRINAIGDAFNDALNPFREAFENLDLPNLILAALTSDSLADGIAVIARGLGDEFARVFADRVAEAERTGQPLSFSDKALGVAGVGLSSFVGGFGAGQELGKGKGALAGAGAGAVAGIPLAGITGGASIAIGAIAGAIGGWIGGMKKAKEALADLREAQAAVLQEFGGFDALKAKADSFGISIGSALTTKNADQFRRTMEELGKAIDAQTVRLEGFAIAVEGINVKAALFAAPFEALLQNKEIDGFTAKLAEMGQRGQAEFERIGTFAAAAFAGMVKESGDAIGAINALAPSLTILQKGLKEFGLTSTGTIDSLLGMFSFINDAVTGPIFQAIQATGQIFDGLTKGGLITKDIFQLVATDIGASFRELEAKGGDVAMAMALSQPVLQKLWEGQKLYGAITDETTQRILEQAHEQGIVGDHMKDVNQKILDVLIAIADVFGAKLPDAFRATAGAAQDAARGIQREFGNLRLDPIRIQIEYEDPGFPGGQVVPRLAHGGIVRRPTLALVGEAGPEAVVPLNQLGSVSPQGTSTVIFEVAGQRIARATVPYLPGEIRRYVPA